MNFDRDPSSADEYFVTALQIFDCCGVEGSGSLRVDALMDKFAPFVKTNKDEFSFLKTVLDPEQSNPDINVTKLAKALHKYSENQKTKVDLEESFNLKIGQAPQDSDSGISTDGLQLLEELQCELKEKEHLTHQLRSQLDFTDRQHEETLAAITAERDSLRKHLNMVREENASISHVRRDYDEACERLCASETALADAKRELESLKKRARVYHEQVAAMENDKLTLQELLSKSKDECHRINEMYAARQSALLEETETLRSERADLAARLQDQEEFMQQIIKEKVLLEMELKDVLNKSNQTHLRLDRSIDVSYTEEQMLNALDTLNSDSRFSQENRLLDEESFISALKEDQGRATNMSLFDEIRLSYNMSRNNINFDNFLERSISNHSFVTFGTQTGEDYNDIKPCADNFKAHFCLDIRKREKFEIFDQNMVGIGTQTENEATDIAIREKCEVSNVETQTDGSKDLLPVDKNKVQSNSKILVDTWTQTLGSFIKTRAFINQHRVSYTKAKPKKAVTAETQTEAIELLNIINKSHCSTCVECENSHKYTAKLEKDLQYSNLVVAEVKVEIAMYEENLALLQKLINEGHNKNEGLESVVKDLNAKIEILEAACSKQREVINNILEPEVCCVDCQTEFDQTSVSTQVEVPCAECEKRNAVVPYGSIRRFFWEALRCLFQLFAVVCFAAAVCVLCGAARRAGGAGAGRCRAAPWRWLHAQDIVDLLLRIEYTSEVPM